MGVKEILETVFLGTSNGYFGRLQIAKKKGDYEINIWFLLG